MLFTKYYDVEDSNILAQKCLKSLEDYLKIINKASK